MLDLMATEACSPGKLSDLMQRALNYLHTFWQQLFAYRNDGEYMIDNLVAYPNFSFIPTFGGSYHKRLVS